MATLRPAFLLIVLGGGVILAQQPAARNPLSGDPSAIAAGQRTYEQTCSTCHGAGGQGDRGPALNTGAFSRGSNDGDLFRTIREGVSGTQMPPFRAHSDNQVWQLISYVRSLSSSSSAGAAPVPGDRAAGEGLFFGKAGCAGCHQVNGKGGVTGPDLSTAGRNAPAALRQKILDPAAPIAGTGRGGPGQGRGGPARPQVLVVTTRDGREVRGVRRNEDTFSVQIVDTFGTLHLFDKLQLASFRVENASLMPADYRTRLTTGEIDNLVAYLASLRERSPFIADVSSLANGVTVDRLVNAVREPNNWLMYWGNYQG